MQWTIFVGGDLGQSEKMPEESTLKNIQPRVVICSVCHRPSIIVSAASQTSTKVHSKSIAVRLKYQEFFKILGESTWGTRMRPGGGLEIAGSTPTIAALF